MKKHSFIMEALPDEIQAKIEKRNRLLSKNKPAAIGGHTFSLVIDDLKLWRVGVIEVSFKGGTSDLHQKIAETAKEWCNYGNIQFDFGFDPAAGTYRQWHPSDNSHIRVGFEYAGYWSLVGTDSRDPLIVQPGDITLNLSGFDEYLPDGWKGTVLHEFGHALAFHHEHQTQDLLCDFDWELLYENLGGPPNNWPKAKVDHNLRQLMGGPYTYSAHDKHSIMHYSFPSWMFIKQEESPCFTEPNHALSQPDKDMMQRAYPYQHAMIEEKDEKRINSLKAILSSEEANSPTAKFHKDYLNYYEKAKQNAIS